MMPCSGSAVALDSSPVGLVGVGVGRVNPPPPNLGEHGVFCFRKRRMCYSVYNKPKFRGTRCLFHKKIHIYYICDEINMANIVG